MGFCEKYHANHTNQLIIDCLFVLIDSVTFPLIWWINNLVGETNFFIIQNIRTHK